MPMNRSVLILLLLPIMVQKYPAYRHTFDVHAKTIGYKKYYINYVNPESALFCKLIQFTLSHLHLNQTGTNRAEPDEPEAPIIPIDVNTDFDVCALKATTYPIRLILKTFGDAQVVTSNIPSTDTQPLQQQIQLHLFT